MQSSSIYFLDVDIPANWKIMNNDEVFERIQLTVSDQECKDIEKAVLSTADTTCNQIVKVARNLLPLVNHFYIAKPLFSHITLIMQPWTSFLLNRNGFKSYKFLQTTVYCNLKFPYPQWNIKKALISHFLAMSQQWSLS